MARRSDEHGGGGERRGRRRDRPRGRRRSEGRREEAPRRDRERGELRILWGLLRLSAGADGAGHFGVLWGLLRVDRSTAGAWRLRLVWGLIDVSTPGATGLFEPRPAALAVPPVPPAPPAPAAESSEAPGDESEVESVPSGKLHGAPIDPYRQAVERAGRQAEAIRKACIVAGTGLGFGLIGAWALTALLVAIAGGILVASFAERLVGRSLGHELESADQEQTEAQSAAAAHALELQTLSASIAHEIRNPITAAKSLVQQMGEDTSAPENVEYAQVALQELDRVERSVSHLLRFAREEKLEAQEVALVEVVENALAVLAERTDKLGVEIRTDLEGPAVLSGDSEKLRRIVINLVGNAFDALAESATESPCVTVELGENLAGTEVWLRVRDNGPGIAPDAQREIFSPFHTSKEDGTGLGLAITRKLVEAHRGQIELKSELGAGADFLVTFPKGQPND